MPDKESIEKIYQDKHDELTRTYYANKEAFPGGKAAFDTAHAKVWRDLETALTVAGYYIPPGPAPIDMIEERLLSLEERVKALEVMRTP